MFIPVKLIGNDLLTVMNSESISSMHIKPANGGNVYWVFNMENKTQFKSQEFDNPAEAVVWLKGILDEEYPTE